MLMLIGGNKIAGIHGAHFGPGIHIRYAAADGTRQTIPWIEYRNANSGKVQTFVSSGSTARFHQGASQIRNAVRRLPQPSDPHFRSAGARYGQGSRRGDIAVTLPYIKKKGVEAPEGRATRQAKRRTDRLPGRLSAFTRRTTQTFTQTLSRHQSSRSGGSCDLQPQRLPGLEGDMGHLPEQPRPHGFSGVFSVPRRLARGGRWKNDHSRLQHLS